MARSLARESALLRSISREVGVAVATLKKSIEDSQTRPAFGRAWFEGAGLEAVITTTAMNLAAKSPVPASCRSAGPANVQQPTCCI